LNSLTLEHRKRLLEELSDAIVLQLSDVPGLMWSSPLMRAFQKLTEDPDRTFKLYNDYPKLTNQTGFSTQLYLQMLWSAWPTDKPGIQGPSKAFRQTANIIIKAVNDTNSGYSPKLAIKAVEMYEKTGGINADDLSRMFRASLLIIDGKPNGLYNSEENLLLTSLLLKLAQRSGFSRLKILSICLHGAKINSRTAGWTRYAIPLLRDLHLEGQATDDPENTRSLEEVLIVAMVEFWNENMKDSASRAEEATILFSILNVLDNPASLAKRILKQIQAIDPTKFEALNSAFKYPKDCLSSHHLYSSVN
jgi:hypothetical protein